MHNRRTHSSSVVAYVLFSTQTTVIIELYNSQSHTPVIISIFVDFSIRHQKPYMQQTYIQFRQHKCAAYVERGRPLHTPNKYSTRQILLYKYTCEAVF